jgi:putative ABC transport system permease protein
MSTILRARARDEGGEASRLRPADVISLAALGLRGRPVRAVLSALGIALGVATMVAVLGISSSSRSQLVAEIDALGTNLLTVTPSSLFGNGPTTLPNTAPAMIARIGPVLADSAIGAVPGGVYRNRLIPSVNTNAISIYSATPGLLGTVEGQLDAGAFLNGATEHFPTVVLGADAASALGVDSSSIGTGLWLGGHDFTVVGILDPVALAPELDRAALIGVPIAEQLFRAGRSPVEVYVRTDPTSVSAVSAVVPATADPSAPQNVAVSNPTDALVARADASAAFEGLFLALGGVALLVGGVGIANVMVISVLERRGEIGLRRALGATRRQVAVQFLAEAVLLSALGGLAGALLGGAATELYSSLRHWTATVPPVALVGACALATVIGGIAGLYPSLRATRLSPTEALRSL